jgi:hypothetical protein
VPRSARGQDENRHGHAAFAPAAQQGEPVQLGQAEIEDHGVVTLRLAQILTPLAVVRPIDRVPSFLQSGLELLGESRFVLDHQDLHAHPPDSILAAGG